MHDTYHQIRPVRSVSPVAVGTTGIGQVGKPVDRRGYRGVGLIVEYGSITATNAVFSVVVKEGDTTGAMTSVADSDLRGTEAAAGVGATGTRVSGVSKNVTKQIQYLGSKRYVSGSVKSTVTAAVPVAINVLLTNPMHAPAS